MDLLKKDISGVQDEVLRGYFRTKKLVLRKIEHWEDEMKRQQQEHAAAALKISSLRRAKAAKIAEFDELIDQAVEKKKAENLDVAACYQNIQELKMQLIDIDSDIKERENGADTEANLPEKGLAA